MEQSVYTPRMLMEASVEFFFTATSVSVDQRAGFLFTSQLNGWDDRGNAVKSIHEVAVDVIRDRSGYGR